MSTSSDSAVVSSVLRWIPIRSLGARHRARVLAHLLAEADAAGQVDWRVSVDATIARAHQHGTNTTRPEQDTGGPLELQESTPRGV